MIGNGMVFRFYLGNIDLVRLFRWRGGGGGREESRQKKKPDRA